MHGEQASNPHGDFHARTLVRGTCVRVSGDTAHVGIPGQEPVAEPRIELIRSSDVIQAIDIICGCGQQIRLHCHYEITNHKIQITNHNTNPTTQPG